MMIRVMPPATGANSHTVNGRTYSAQPGAVLDVPDFDGAQLVANGWTQAGEGVGSTAQRPANPRRGMHFKDTTLGRIVVFDGKTWRDPATGTAV